MCECVGCGEKNNETFVVFIPTLLSLYLLWLGRNNMMSTDILVALARRAPRHPFFSACCCLFIIAASALVLAYALAFLFFLVPGSTLKNGKQSCAETNLTNGHLHQPVNGLP